MSINKELLRIIACPKCNGDLNEEKMFLVCEKCKLAYPVLDGVPNMLIDEAWPIDEAKNEDYKHKLKL
ncbi:MAG: Trm112 family protein [Candidatus Aenigmarchaeota archaeon]|nr:Trm112 family protein [Candidatus Aenigmarchaeota archaeon]